MLLLLAIVRLDVCHPCIFGLLLGFLGKVEQYVETREVGIALEDSLRLLAL